MTVRGWLSSPGDDQLNQFGRGRETKGARDEGGGTVAALTIHFGIRAGLPHGTDGAVTFGEHGWLGGEHAINAEGLAFPRETVLFAEQAAGLLEQPVMGSPAEIGATDGGGITATAGTARDHDGQLAFLAFCNEQCFMLQAVDGIQDTGAGDGEEFFGGGRGKEFLDRMHATFRIDGQDSFLEDSYLGLAQLTADGRELAIGVADANFVQINQRQLPDASARQSLNGP